MSVSRIHRCYRSNPVERSKTRLMMYRIKRDWYGLAEKILANDDNSAEARRDLRESLLSIGPLFQETMFFMSDDYSLLDCLHVSIVVAFTAIGH